MSDYKEAICETQECEQEECDCCSCGHIHEEDKTDNSNKMLTIILLSGIFFAIGMLLRVTGSDSPIIIDLFFALAYLLSGTSVLMRAGKNILRGRVFDENFLMGIATIGAILIGQLPEGVAVMLFYQIGEYFQALAVRRSRKSITGLMDLRPDYANLLIGDEEKRVKPEEVQIGETILVKPGEKVPLDGILVEGESMLDTSSLTGESFPKDVYPGIDVLSGCINLRSVIKIKVEKAFQESTVSKILSLVENAASKKSPTENFISSFARVYTPVVVIAAALLAVLPPLFLPDARFYDWLYRALIFLVISCPCALVISVPLGFFAGLGGASKRGILIKGSNYLQAIANVDTVVFDKTGTLTKGTFAVTKIVPSGNIHADELLNVAAYAESYSSHPIGLSIVNAFHGEIDKKRILNFTELSGYGTSIEFDGKSVTAGNKKLMEMKKIACPELDEHGTVVHVAVDGGYAGYILISDEVKTDAKKAVSGLTALGVKNIVMLTGDNRVVAAAVSKELGIKNVFYELLPDQKVGKIEELKNAQAEGRKLAFVGDGINDAPVLARSDIGIAMGGLGSDAAIEAADIVLMNDAPSALVTSVKIARKVKSLVTQNIVFALSVKSIILILGAFGAASMWMAIFADVGVALLAVLNSLRALNTEAF